MCVEREWIDHSGLEVGHAETQGHRVGGRASPHLNGDQPGRARRAERVGSCTTTSPEDRSCGASHVLANWLDIVDTIYCGTVLYHYYLELTPGGIRIDLAPHVPVKIRRA